MYCKNGADPNVDNQNANDVSKPLFNVGRSIETTFLTSTHHIYATGNEEGLVDARRKRVRQASAPGGGIPGTVSHIDLRFALPCIIVLQFLATTRPSGGQVTLELATNRAFTTASTQPLRLGVFGNGEDFIFPEHISEEGCVWEPNRKMPTLMPFCDIDSRLYRSSSPYEIGSRSCWNCPRHFLR